MMFCELVNPPHQSKLNAKSLFQQTNHLQMVPTDMHIRLLPLSTNRIPIRERQLLAKDKKTHGDGRALKNASKRKNFLTTFPPIKKLPPTISNHPSPTTVSIKGQCFFELVKYSGIILKNSPLFSILPPKKLARITQ